jgi:hypothetical protein
MSTPMLSSTVSKLNFLLLLFQMFSDRSKKVINLAFLQLKQRMRLDNELNVLNFLSSDKEGRKMYHGQVLNGEADGVGTLFYHHFDNEERVRYEGQFK